MYRIPVQNDRDVITFIEKEDIELLTNIEYMRDKEW